MSSPRLINMEEIQQHKTRSSFYLLLHGKVYDVTEFLDEHPGGDDMILMEAGKDATQAFEDENHSEDARAMLADFYIGDFDPTVSKGSDS